MYTGNEPGLSLRNSNDCPFLCLPPGALAVLKTVSPLECIRPQVHWKNDNILLETGNLTHSRALAGDEKRNCTHIHNLSDMLLFSIEYHL